MRPRLGRPHRCNAGPGGYRGERRASARAAEPAEPAGDLERACIRPPRTGETATCSVGCRGRPLPPANEWSSLRVAWHLRVTAAVPSASGATPGASECGLATSAAGTEGLGGTPASGRGGATLDGRGGLAQTGGGVKGRRDAFEYGYRYAERVDQPSCPALGYERPQFGQSVRVERIRGGPGNCDCLIHAIGCSPRGVQTCAVAVDGTATAVLSALAVQCVLDPLQVLFHGALTHRHAHFVKSGDDLRGCNRRIFKI